MHSWIKAAATYRKPGVLATLFLGFSSGLPFLLILATLHVWLSESGINKTTIGLFVLVTIPYSLKFVWAPVIDHFRFPVLCAFFGKRKGWMLAAQLMLLASLLLLGSTEPAKNIWMTAGSAFLVALFSATQDIVIDAFRVESLEQSMVGPGASASSIGYRLGMWVSGAGALYLASSFSWQAVYGFMACAVSIGMVTTLLSDEPAPKSDSLPVSINIQIKQRFVQSFNTILQRQDLPVIVGFILFYKIGDTVLNTMTMPFLLETGFSKIEIAHVAKSFGIAAMIIGGLAGGAWMARGNISKALIATSILQIIASMMFCIQASVGHNLGMLFATLGVENFACGLGGSAFIAYLSTRCQSPHTGTHFALLTSLASFSRVVLSSLAGWTADHLPWTSFYGLTAILCIPCLLLIILRPHIFQYSHVIHSGNYPNMAKASMPSPSKG